MMLEPSSNDIRRNRDGSIDTAYYLAVGRRRRSKQTYLLLILVGIGFERLRIVLRRDQSAKKLSRPI